MDKDTKTVAQALILHLLFDHADIEQATALCKTFGFRLPPCITELVFLRG